MTNEEGQEPLELEMERFARTHTQHLEELLDTDECPVPFAAQYYIADALGLGYVDGFYECD